MANYKIIYSAEVTERLFDVVDYLENKWSDTVADHFLLTFIEKVTALAINPKVGRFSKENKSIRSTSITKHNRLYYRFDKDVIQLLSLIDTRQNPQK